MNGARVNGHGGSPATANTANRRTIPFDYAFRFDLAGVPGNGQQKTVTVSIEASFTAVSLGYGVIPFVSTRRFGLLPPDLAGGLDDAAGAKPLFRELEVLLRAANNSDSTTKISTDAQRAAIRLFAQRSFLRLSITSLADAMGEPLTARDAPIGPQTAAALREGIRFNPDLVEQLLLTMEGGPLDDTALLETFETINAPTDGIQFKYALFDDGSGREFQSEPILSTAGLGASDGGRPFRYFARPIEFLPRTTVRMQISEVSNFKGELHVSLQGYKTLGGAGSPTAVGGDRRREGRRRR